MRISHSKVVAYIKYYNFRNEKKGYSSRPGIEPGTSHLRQVALPTELPGHPPDCLNTAIYKFL